MKRNKCQGHRSRDINRWSFPSGSGTHLPQVPKKNAPLPVGVKCTVPDSHYTKQAGPAVLVGTVCERQLESTAQWAIQGGHRYCLVGLHTSVTVC